VLRYNDTQTFVVSSHTLNRFVTQFLIGDEGGSSDQTLAVALKWTNETASR